MGDDLEAKLDHNQEHERGEEDLPAGHLPPAFVAFIVSADPRHERRVDAEEDGAADSAGVAERDQEDVGVDHRDDERGDEDEEAEKGFAHPFFLDLEAIGEEVEEGERKGDVGGCHGEEGERFADADHIGVVDEVLERDDGVLPFEARIDESFGAVDRDDAENEHLPNEVDDERDRGSEDD